MKTTSVLSTLLLSTLALAAPCPVANSQPQNSQTFTGALGGITATPVVNSGDSSRPFSVNGDTFVNLAAALQRSCDEQFNACADAANAGKVDFTVSDCQTQENACLAAN